MWTTTRKARRTATIATSNRKEMTGRRKKKTRTRRKEASKKVCCSISIRTFGICQSLLLIRLDQVPTKSIVCPTPPSTVFEDCLGRLPGVFVSQNRVQSSCTLLRLSPGNASRTPKMGHLQGDSQQRSQRSPHHEPSNPSNCYSSRSAAAAGS
jgi:hypothetical protein